jgi:predicted alpha/beta superfamily hydrolase
MDNEDLYRNLVIFLKIFKNRPYHLAKHLVENNAFTKEFLKKIAENPKLREIPNEPNDDSRLPVIYFADINKMNEYYNSLTEENIDKTPEQIATELNLKLESLIEQEKYEEAARLRDYMNRIKIKRS